ncbi:MAG: hypothetical protein Q4G34_11335 [Micrococcus sp.]|nr:hypothetical protein [Micrococcus sp.]
MDDPTNLADVAVMAILALTGIIIVGIVFFTRSRSGVEQIRKAELERDEAQQRADRLQTRVEQLEDRLDRRIGRDVEQDEFDRRLES